MGCVKRVKWLVAKNSRVAIDDARGSITRMNVFAAWKINLSFSGR